MNIKCSLGLHDYENFGKGIKLTNIIEEAVNSKVKEFNMEMYTSNIIESVKEQEISDILPYNLSRSSTEFRINNTVVKDKICLRCGKITMVIKLCRTVMESRAESAINKIITKEERQEKAKEMIKKLSSMSKCI